MPFTKEAAVAAAQKFLELVEAQAESALTLEQAVRLGATTLHTELSHASGGDATLYQKVRDQVKAESEQNKPIAPHGAFAKLGPTP